jgi:hypothetical protein
MLHQIGLSLFIWSPQTLLNHQQPFSCLDYHKQHSGWKVPS